VLAAHGLDIGHNPIAGWIAPHTLEQIVHWYPLFAMLRCIRAAQGRAISRRQDGRLSYMT
jgi:hypothetical protein